MLLRVARLTVALRLFEVRDFGLTLSLEAVPLRRTVELLFSANFSTLLRCFPADLEATLCLVDLEATLCLVDLEGLEATATFRLLVR